MNSVMPDPLGTDEYVGEIPAIETDLFYPSTEGTRSHQGQTAKQANRKKEVRHPINWTPISAHHWSASGLGYPSLYSHGLVTRSLNCAAKKLSTLSIEQTVVSAEQVK